MADLLFGSPAYLSTFTGAGAVGDAAALAFLRARKWDSLGTGLGNPQEGHWYVNVTDHTDRHYLNAAWEARDAAGTARPASTVDGVAAATVRAGAAAGATASQPAATLIAQRSAALQRVAFWPSATVHPTIPTHYLLKTSDPGGAGSSITSAALAPGNDQSIAEWTLAAADLQRHVLAEEHLLEVIARRVSGDRVVSLHMRYLERAAGGVETPLSGFQGETGPIPGAPDPALRYFLYRTPSLATILAGGSRLVVQLLANVGGGSVDSEVQLTLEGVNACTVQVPTYGELRAGQAALSETHAAATGAGPHGASATGASILGAASAAAARLVLAVGQTVVIAGDPGVNDDSAHGYLAGDMVQSGAGGKFWQCLAATVGAAVWEKRDGATDTRTPLAHTHAPGDTTGTAVITADARLAPAPALADALKVVRQNAAGDAYEAVVVLGSAAQAGTGDFAPAAQAVPVPAVPGDNNKVLASVAGTPGWVAPTGGSPSPIIRNRLGTTPPAGASAFEAVWNFDLTAGQLNDRTANGHNATLAAGTLRATRLAGLPCVHSDSGKLSVPTSAALRTLAAVTIETSIRWRALTGHQCLLVCGDGSSQANNINYSLYINNTNQTFFILHQHGNLVSDTWITSAAAPLCDLCYVVLVRNAAGTAYDLYLNGTLLDSTTGVTAPTDGGSSTLRLLDSHGGGQATLASILDLRISMQAMTSDMIAEVWTGLITP